MHDTPPPMTFHIRLWLESPTGFKFGQGTAELLRRIEQDGSLRKAAISMGMSYRRAWGRLKRTEEDLGQALVCKPGGNKAGYRLTEMGERLLRGFENWHEEVRQYAATACERYFPHPEFDICAQDSDSSLHDLADHD